MKRYWIFLSIVCVTIAVAYVVREGYYPIAMVGNTLLSARDFSKQFEAATTYYRKAQTAYGASSTSPVSNLEESVFESLIEDALIHTEVEKEIGKEAPRMAADRADTLLRDTDLLAAAEAVYGLDKEEFRKMVLMPQAEREMLTGKLFLHGMGLADWLAAAKQKERILLLVPGFRWAGGEIKKEKP